jgi:hypothetical protein
MKLGTLFFVIVFLLSSCNKKDGKVEPPPVITIADSSLQIVSLQKTEINELDILYAVKPPTGEYFSRVFLSWSTSADFTIGKDSIAVSPTPSQPLAYHISRLKQATQYYGRIGVDYKGKRFYSPVKEWSTDSLKLTQVGDRGTARGLNKGDSTFIITNLQPVTAVQGSDTKVLLGTYECVVVSDQGRTIQFRLPTSTPVGKYILKLITRGMEVLMADSIEVLRGDWSFVTPPPIPVNPNAITSGLFFFGTCIAPQKGYILGGNYFNGPQVTWPNSQWPEFILEFNEVQQAWTKRFPLTSRYFENPICYYYNNSIYVIGAATQYFIDPFTNVYLNRFKRMQRLDLSSLTWFDLDSVPYPTLFNMTSFELNNEWYIGGGADSANVTICCGVPIPSKKFWKYNPANNQWTQVADFPGGYQVNPTSFSIGSKGYSFYGAIPIGDPITTLNFTQEFWEYNPAANSWASIPLPASGGPPKGEKYSIVSYNGRAYFLSAQVRTIAGGGYEYNGLDVYLEWNPATPTLYRYVSFPQGGDIYKCYYRNGSKFYFQSDALGYYNSIPNRTYSFTIEQ